LPRCEPFDSRHLPLPLNPSPSHPSICTPTHRISHHTDTTPGASSITCPTCPQTHKARLAASCLTSASRCLADSRRISSTNRPTTQPRIHTQLSIFDQTPKKKTLRDIQKDHEGWCPWALSPTDIAPGILIIIQLKPK
jgi:hypothetical protein